MKMADTQAVKNVRRQSNIPSKVGGASAFKGYQTGIPKDATVLKTDKTILFADDGGRLSKEQFVERWINPKTGGQFRDAWVRTVSGNTPEGKILKQLMDNVKRQRTVMGTFSKAINSALLSTDTQNISFTVPKK